MKVYNGPDTNANLVGKFCGPTVPGDIITTQSAAFVSFSSDYSVTRSGFNIRYSRGELYTIKNQFCQNRMAGGTMEGRSDGRAGGRAEGRTDARTEGRRDIRTDGRTGGQVCGWVGGLADIINVKHIKNV